MFIEILLSISGLAFGIFLTVFAFAFPASNLPEIPGASFFPLIISTMIVCFSSVNLIIAFFKTRKKTIIGLKEKTYQNNMPRVMKVIFLMLVYCVLWFYNIGHFLINTIAVFIPITLLYGVEQQWWKTVIFVIVLVLFIYFFFNFFLRVPL